MMNVPPGRSKKPISWLLLSPLDASGSTLIDISILLVCDIVTFFVWGGSITQSFRKRLRSQKSCYKKTKQYIQKHLDGIYNKDLT